MFRANYEKYFYLMFPNAQYNVKILSDNDLRCKVKTYIAHKRLPRITPKRLSSAQIKYVNRVMKKRALPDYINNLLTEYPNQIEIVGSYKWGYWITNDSKEFEKYIHKLITGKDKISDLDVVIKDPSFPIEILSALPIKVEIKADSAYLHKRIFNE